MGKCLWKMAVALMYVYLSQRAVVWGLVGWLVGFGGIKTLLKS